MALEQRRRQRRRRQHGHGRRRRRGARARDGRRRHLQRREHVDQPAVVARLRVSAESCEHGEHPALVHPGVLGGAVAVAGCAAAEAGEEAAEGGARSAVLRQVCRGGRRGATPQTSQKECESLRQFLLCATVTLLCARTATATAKGGRGRESELNAPGSRNVSRNGATCSAYTQPWHARSIIAICGAGRGKIG